MVLLLIFSLFVRIFSKCLETSHKSYNKHCYFAVNELKTWIEAEQYCYDYPFTLQIIHGHLASITSSAEEINIKSLLLQQHDYWIGFHDIFQYVATDHLLTTDGVTNEGKPFDFKDIRFYTNIEINELRKFMIGVNNATCFYMSYLYNKKWIPEFCNVKKKYFICKYPDPSHLGDSGVNRPNNWDNVYNYEVTIYYKRAYCKFSDGCPEHFYYCGEYYYDHNDVCNHLGPCESYNNCNCDSTKYGGYTCEDPMCNGLIGIFACSGRGLCLLPENCQCFGNNIYEGTYCQYTWCSGIKSDVETVCNSHGKCVDYNRCECEEHYYGRNCDIWECEKILSNSSVVCGGNKRGYCNENTLLCDCNKEYLGNNCQYTSCFGIISTDVSVCSGNGKCLNFDKCKCDSNWNGTECQIPLCFGIEADDVEVCSSHGKCVDVNKCDCYPSFGGSKCNERTCYGRSSLNACSKNGVCKLVNNRYVCVCDNGYVGRECEEYYCFKVSSKNSSVCSGRGKCLSTNNCECSDEWSGPECNIPKCNGVPANERDVCSGAGTCYADHRCSCNTNWRVLFTLREGIFCEQSFVGNLFTINFPYLLWGLVFFGFFICIALAMVFCNVRYMYSFRDDTTPSFISFLWPWSGIKKGKDDLKSEMEDEKEIDEDDDKTFETIEDKWKKFDDILDKFKTGGKKQKNVEKSEEKIVFEDVSEDGSDEVIFIEEKERKGRRKKKKEGESKRKNKAEGRKGKKKRKKSTSEKKKKKKKKKRGKKKRRKGKEILKKKEVVEEEENYEFLKEKKNFQSLDLEMGKGELSEEDIVFIEDTLSEAENIKTDTLTESDLSEINKITDDEFTDTEFTDSEVFTDVDMENEGKQYENQILEMINKNIDGVKEEIKKSDLDVYDDNISFSDDEDESEKSEKSEEEKDNIEIVFEEIDDDENKEKDEIDNINFDEL